MEIIFNPVRTDFLLNRCSHVFFFSILFIPDLSHFHLICLEREITEEKDHTALQMCQVSERINLGRYNCVIYSIR